MRINRITFSIDKGVLDDQQLKHFNMVASFFEELLFNYLPKNAEVGGYGFLNIRFCLELNMPEMKAYGQIIEVWRQISKERIKALMSGQIRDRVAFLGNQLILVLEKATQEISFNYEEFKESISKAIENYAGFERELKVSKSHRSRKFGVSIYRIVKPEIESIACRIRKKSGEIIDEFDLIENSSVYDSVYDFRKSKWDENLLLILDRFDRVKYSIDTSKYVE